MPKPKVILQLYPTLPTEDRADREAKRPIGRDGDLYHEVLHEWLEVVKAADETTHEKLISMLVKLARDDAARKVDLPALGRPTRPASAISFRRSQ